MEKKKVANKNIFFRAKIIVAIQWHLSVLSLFFMFENINIALIWKTDLNFKSGKKKYLVSEVITPILPCTLKNKLWFVSEFSWKWELYETFDFVQSGLN